MRVLATFSSVLRYRWAEAASAEGRTPDLTHEDETMRIIDVTLDEFRKKVVDTCVPVRVIRTTVPGFRTVGNQVVAELAVVVEYLADLVALDGETEMWTATEHRVVGPRGEFDLSGVLYESLPNVTFVKRAGTF